ncbi:spermidine/putrescine ABC transporter ATP-binding protein [Virgibacillus indicus]|uniref:Spermidine/putrescine ABC transporter ATP-binding protein n=1 Tax=Virgibacillus indicus TaxID=2024554 RepID=A0A265N909_9BACI|nr:ABC transporter ATP-binding protein [Virgibacillus indicus]OZU88520.1 spermidine/putrescine ABC transporter ATP-binding protein [Virgibacillus indicus]
MIQLEKVTKKYLRHKAVNQCTATLEAGKIIGLIGENGSGKTTILKLLAGLLRPTNGRVLIDSKQVNRSISDRLAYLTDMDYFYPYFTIKELIDFYHSQFKDFDKKKAMDMAAFMKLNVKQKIRYLSKGNLSRVKIAVTLSRNVPYIVLDEPFSGLDPLVRKSIINGIIKFMNLESQTLIVTTHELREVEPILDEVLLLKDGRIIAQKSVDQIRDDYRMDVVDWMEQVYETTK